MNLREIINSSLQMMTIKIQQGYLRSSICSKDLNDLQVAAVLTTKKAVWNQFSYCGSQIHKISYLIDSYNRKMKTYIPLTMCMFKKKKQ